jgi:hypothetical protein
MLFGAFFAMSMFAALYSFAGLLGGLSNLLKTVIDRDILFSAAGLLTVSSVLSGYIGGGPSSSLETSDEYVIMPAPIRPHQLLLARYIRRLLRRLSIAGVVLFTLVPVFMTAPSLLTPVAELILSTLLFFEFNHFLSEVTSQLRTRLDARTHSRLRHLSLFALGGLMLFPVLPQVVGDPGSILLVPSNAFSVMILASLGVYYPTLMVDIGAGFLFIGYLVGLLVLANLCDQSMYESFAAAGSAKESGNRFGRIVHGSVDFSNHRFSDPMVCIMVKDFWTRMRTPLQFWKYVYFAAGMLLVLWLNLVQPSSLPPLQIPSQLSASAVPAFLMVLVILCQMSSMSALVSFLDEKDNIYLLKTSPFRKSDIILAKYVGSLFESAISLLPVLGLSFYFFHPQGSLMFVTLSIPFLILFNASGIMIGSYVPVLTNDPENPPVPMVFSFPTINLGMGALIVVIVNSFLKSTLLLLILPTLVVLLSVLFLGLSVSALDAFK